MLLVFETNSVSWKGDSKINSNMYFPKVMSTKTASVPPILVDYGPTRTADLKTLRKKRTRFPVLAPAVRQTMKRL